LKRIIKVPEFNKQSIKLKHTLPLEKEKKNIPILTDKNSSIIRGFPYAKTHSGKLIQKLELKINKNKGCWLRTITILYSSHSKVSKM
jgi:hypothetical protein